MYYNFYVIGLGGTGSLIARDLPKLLIGRDDESKIVLIDGDIVEKKNMDRQSYQAQDVGDYKSDMLAKKINSFYGTNCFSKNTYLQNDELIRYTKEDPDNIIIIGCVDNDATRKILEKSVNSLIKNEDMNIFYIDSANGEYDGNIYSFYHFNGKDYGVMRSSIYDLEDDIHPMDASCEEQAKNGNVQYLVTNAKMSVGILELCNAILENRPAGGIINVKRFTQIYYD